ncbi:MAG: 50S ribosomal protein L35 [Bdellovibrionales bacterium]|nr:50S ribosomal protein L35 [Bdellovibrionales bacterium]
MANKSKTHKGASKRFRLTGKGLLKRKKKGLRHILSNKSSKRKRHLGKKTYVHSFDARGVEKQLSLR